jgi:hypothetical protein
LGTGSIVTFENSMPILYLSPTQLNVDVASKHRFRLDQIATDYQSLLPELIHAAPFDKAPFFQA